MQFLEPIYADFSAKSANFQKPDPAESAEFHGFLEPSIRHHQK
jgi:hypothetical protein